MTRNKGSGYDAEGESDPSAREEMAPAETRVLIEEDAASIESRGSDSEAATQLAEDDDLTDLGTRVLDLPEDKTSPPHVSAREPQSAQSVDPKPTVRSAPTPIDDSRGLVPGMILFGEYEIVNVLGVGGMGEVYRARHRRLEEFRAIKVMHADLSNRKGASEFFDREAKALLAVRHPAVVHCHDLLSDDAGRVYLIMEMIEGIPLSKKMNDGPLSPDDVAILGARVSHGLNAAHRKGVIHRDVSPDNIVLPNGRVQEAKLIDFGIAKILEDGGGTIIDGFKGKLAYASPEQLGFFGGQIDGRSDFYSLGLVLVAAALGRPMSMGTTVMEAVDARRAFDTLPDEIPVGLRSAIAPLLALDPKDRPRYVDRLFVVPGGIDDQTDPGGYASGRAESRGDSSRRRDGNKMGLFAGIAAAAGAVVIGGGLSLGMGGEMLAMIAPNPPVQETLERASESDAAASDEPAAGSESELEVVAEIEAPEPTAGRPSANDRIKIIGLLNNAKFALAENRLMSPANDNAYDRYRRVLALDPRNQKAKDGLREVAARYLGLAGKAAGEDDLSQARSFLEQARRADPSHPGIASAESRFTR
jgi:hypothetical protein